MIKLVSYLKREKERVLYQKTVSFLNSWMCGCKLILKCVIKSVLLFNGTSHKMNYISMYFPKAKPNVHTNENSLMCNFFVGLKKKILYMPILKRIKKKTIILHFCQMDAQFLIVSI